MTYDMAIEGASLRRYAEDLGGSNTEDPKRMRDAIPGIIRDHLTDKQRTYILAYFFEGMNVREIGNLHEVNRATVSRTIHRGLKRIYAHLPVDPSGRPKVSMTRAYISNRTKRWMYQ